MEFTKMTQAYQLFFYILKIKIKYNLKQVYTMNLLSLGKYHTIFTDIKEELMGKCPLRAVFTPRIS